jgi:ABC-2 type transport system permease protein
MSSDRGFSLSRWWGVVLKEFLQLRRDRLTLAMIIGIPLVQLTLFGFAINTDPKHMPTGLLCADHSDITRSIIASMKSSEYFRFVGDLPDEEAGRAALMQGRVQFVLTIPPHFTRDLIRGERPAILLEADATDPTATGMALASVNQIARSIALKDLGGTLASLAPGQPPFEVRVHRLYNPEGIPCYNIIPGLMGVILTLMMTLMTGLAITRERERGTMENMLAMPLRPIEVMTGKLVPYIFIGLIQSTIIVLAARFVFRVPFVGSPVLLYVAALFLVAANLTVGITLSSLARNQLQAMQMAMFYFLPNLMLSGFMFPFQGMPKWAQCLGNLLPLTHFNRMVRGVFLKGMDWWDLWPHLWPLMVFTVIVMAIAVKSYRKTLD